MAFTPRSTPLREEKAEDLRRQQEALARIRQAVEEARKQQGGRR